MEEKLTFQRAISAGVSDHDIPNSLVLNIDQILLSISIYRKIHFSSKCAKNVTIKGVNDKRQTTSISAVSSTGNFLPMQLIYTGKTRRCLPRCEFPASFSASFTKSHRSNAERSNDFLKKLSVPISKK